MELTNKELEMLNEKVVPLLFKFGIPTMLGMIINAVYNLVDTYFIGSFGMIQTASVSIVFPLTLLVTGFGVLFGNGTGSKISRLLGNQKYQEVSEYFSTSVASAVFSGILLSILLLFTLKPILISIGADSDTLPYAMQYGTIIVAGFTFSLFNVTANNLAVAEGATVFSSITLLIGALLNIILDPIFVFVFHMGIEGIAYATVLSSAVSSVIYIHHFLFGKTLLPFSFKNVKPSIAIYSNICKIGVPLLAFQLLNMAALSVTNFLAVQYGNPTVTAFGITYKLFCLEINAVFGFLKGYQPLAGYNYGAEKFKRVLDFTYKGVLITTVFCIICNTFLIILAPQAIYLFNQDSAEVLSFGTHVLRWQAVGYLSLGFQFVGASYFLSIGKVKQGGILSLSRGILFLLFSFILNAAFHRAGLLCAYPLTELAASIITITVFFYSKKQSIVINPV